MPLPSTLRPPVHSLYLDCGGFTLDSRRSAVPTRTVPLAPVFALYAAAAAAAQPVLTLGSVEASLAFDCARCIGGRPRWTGGHPASLGSPAAPVAAGAAVLSLGLLDPALQRRPVLFGRILAAQGRPGQPVQPVLVDVVQPPGTRVEHPLVRRLVNQVRDTPCGPAGWLQPVALALGRRPGRGRSLKDRGRHHGRPAAAADPPGRRRRGAAAR